MFLCLSLDATKLCIPIKGRVCLSVCFFLFSFSYFFFPFCFHGLSGPWVKCMIQTEGGADVRLNALTLWDIFYDAPSKPGCVVSSLKRSFKHPYVLLYVCTSIIWPDCPSICLSVHPSKTAERTWEHMHRKLLSMRSLFLWTPHMFLFSSLSFNLIFAEFQSLCIKGFGHAHKVIGARLGLHPSTISIFLTIWKSITPDNLQKL